MGTPPQQRNFPGESGRKCSPNRAAEKPLFANQVDPPPERPWPATSDEGNSVPGPRTPEHRPAEDEAAEAACLPDQQPRD